MRNSGCRVHPFYMMNLNTKILTLDMAGNPRRWDPIEHIVEYYAKDKVAWEFGDHSYTMRGGIQRISGLQSAITVRSIVAIKGTEHLTRSERAPVLSRQLLFARDNYRCGYCFQQYDVKLLEMEHIVPKAQGGKNTWTNLVTSCLHCNDIKGNRTPEQADMPLRLNAYIPTRHETLLLSNKHALGDQKEFLMNKSKHIKQQLEVYQSVR